MVYTQVMVRSLDSTQKILRRSRIASPERHHIFVHTSIIAHIFLF